MSSTSLASPSTTSWESSWTASSSDFLKGKGLSSVSNRRNFKVSLTNKNKCLLSQLEDYLFNDTITNLYYRFIDKEKKYFKGKYVVPEFQRRYFWNIFILGLIFHTLKILRKIIINS